MVFLFLPLPCLEARGGVSFFSSFPIWAYWGKVEEVTTHCRVRAYERAAVPSFILGLSTIRQSDYLDAGHHICMFLHDAPALLAFLALLMP